jgi:hypothetical protein
VTPGNIEFVQVLVSMTVETGGVAAVLYVDRCGLFGPTTRSTTWLAATTDAAVLGAFLFGVLYGGPALLVHFIKSRWSVGNRLLGPLLGLVAALSLVATDVAAELGAVATVDWLGL